MPVISGTYYVTVPEGAGAIRFEDPRLAMLMAAPPKKKNARPENRTFVSVAAKARHCCCCGKAGCAMASSPTRPGARAFRSVSITAGLTYSSSTTIGVEHENSDRAAGLGAGDPCRWPYRPSPRRTGAHDGPGAVHANIASRWIFMSATPPGQAAARRLGVQRRHPGRGQGRQCPADLHRCRQCGGPGRQACWARARICWSISPRR